jgi:hypothetical protein
MPARPRRSEAVSRRGRRLRPEAAARGSLQAPRAWPKRIDWAKLPLAPRTSSPSIPPEVISDTLGAFLKYQDDIARVRGTTAMKLLKQVEENAA